MDREEVKMIIGYLSKGNMPTEQRMTELNKRLKKNLSFGNRIVYEPSEVWEYCNSNRYYLRELESYNINTMDDLRGRALNYFE